jgi:hypothetical protein
MHALSLARGREEGAGADLGHLVALARAIEEGVGGSDCTSIWRRRSLGR